MPLILVLSAPILFLVCFTFVVVYMLRLHAKERADMLDRIMFANNLHAMEYEKMKLYKQSVATHEKHKKIKKDAVNHHGQEEYISALDASKDPRLMKRVTEMLNENQQ